VSRRKLLGFHPVREALRGETDRIVRVLVEAGRSGGRTREIERLARDRGVKVDRVSRTELSLFAPGVHNGFGAELEEAKREEVAAGGGDPRLLVLAEDLQDPRNLGALLRVCEGAGVGRLLLRRRGSTSVNETAVKASAGAAAWLPVEPIDSSATALEGLKDEGYWIYGLDAAGEPPWEVDLTGPVVLCVGGEENGLRRLTRERCDRLIGLPMAGRVASLNLATAAAAVLYEAVRQRSGSG